MALDDLIHWYPADAGLLKARVSEEFTEGDNPGVIEVIVAKKLKGKVIENRIAKDWRTYNVIEAQSLSIDLIKNFYLTLSFAYKFQADRYKSERLKINDITINILQEKNPKAFFEFMSQYESRELTNPIKGIYYISDELMPIQVLVASELKKDDLLWIKKLTEIPEYRSSGLIFD